MSDVLAAMEAYADVAPAHNPPYVAAMRLLAKELPQIPLVAAFETGFHETIPPARTALRGAAGMGREARRPALGLPRRQPSLHRRADGAAARASRTRRSSRATWAAAVRCVPSGRASRSATSMGMSPQSGLPHNNRVGDFDVVRPAGADAGDRQDAGTAARRPGQPLRPAGAERAQRPARHRGSRRARATRGAQLALDVFVAAVRHYLGAYLLLLGGADAIVFTGGIGENSARDARGGLRQPGLVRHRASTRRATQRRKGEMRDPRGRQPGAVWIMPTNEEIDRRPAGEGHCSKPDEVRRSCSWPESPAAWWRRRRSPR